MNVLLIWAIFTLHDAFQPYQPQQGNHWFATVEECQDFTRILEASVRDFDPFATVEAHCIASH